MPLTQENRLKGAKNSLTKRQQQQAERRQKVKQMHDDGMSNSEIARKLRIDRGTVILDLKAVESVE